MLQIKGIVTYCLKCFCRENMPQFKRDTVDRNHREASFSLSQIEISENLTF